MLTLKTLFSTQVASVFFPELLRNFGTTYIDLRCGFGKDFLSRGHLKFNSISSMRFIEGDKIEADLHFGCGVYVYKYASKKSELEYINDYSNIIKKKYPNLEFKIIYISYMYIRYINVATRSLGSCSMEIISYFIIQN